MRNTFNKVLYVNKKIEMHSLFFVFLCCCIRVRADVKINTCLVENVNPVLFKLDAKCPIVLSNGKQTNGAGLGYFFYR